MQQTKAVKASREWKKASIVKDFEGSAIERISKEWMLVTAGDKDNYNTMTASWGGVGYLWERAVVFAFVRPSRYTYEFMEKSDRFTLTFFDKSLKAKVHKICGSESGRDIDKPKATGITPIHFDDDTISFKEASAVIICKKLYFDDFKPANFLDREIEKFYQQQNYHRIYVGEVERFYKK
ncbi:MAG: flavin reductase [Campylobacteraceae bacterium]|jgi:flavin reductase (DIM6/NTAB) family NADH-FMN oxidoreductase RutF|nr:flavin reductase [Campylobacteraceae bacterium]